MRQLCTCSLTTCTKGPFRTTYVWFSFGAIVSSSHSNILQPYNIQYTKGPFHPKYICFSFGKLVSFIIFYSLTTYTKGPFHPKHVWLSFGKIVLFIIFYSLTTYTKGPFHPTYIWFSFGKIFYFIIFRKNPHFILELAQCDFDVLGGLRGAMAC